MPRTTSTTSRRRGSAARRSSSPKSSAQRAPGAVKFFEPMKALAVNALPEGDWLPEIKFDGYRALAVRRGGQTELWSRNRKPLTADYPAIAAAVGQLACREVVLDGEIVALDTTGRPRFQLLQRRRGGGAESGPVYYYVFDLLALDGRTWLDEPIEQRKAALATLLGARSPAPLRISEVFPVAPAELLKVARERGLEGVVIKAAGSRYEPGRRSGAWLKCRLACEQEFVIGGFTPPGGSRSHFGAILVGYYERGRLLYAGKVGTGFDERMLRQLHERFVPLQRAACPFANLPLPRRPRWGTGMTRREMAAVTWLQPATVAQIRFSEWTEEGSLRQPVFLGLRTDKAPREVVREAVAG